MKYSDVHALILNTMLTKIGDERAVASAIYDALFKNGILASSQSNKTHTQITLTLDAKDMIKEIEGLIHRLHESGKLE